MKIEANSVEEYINNAPSERRNALLLLRKTIKDHLPERFVEELNYGMPGYVVPHSIYPSGYHCDNKLPLPFINFASQKNYIALYHMGLYVNQDLMDWWINTYNTEVPSKLDMGKSCIRFKKMDQIPFRLIGELTSKMSVNEWIYYYEKQIKR